MKHFLLFLGCLCLTSTAFAQDANEVKAQNIIKLAREALGGEENLKAVQSLTMQGKFTATLMGRPAQGDLKSKWYCRENTCELPRRCREIYCKASATEKPGQVLSETNWQWAVAAELMQAEASVELVALTEAGAQVVEAVEEAVEVVLAEGAVAAEEVEEAVEVATVEWLRLAAGNVQTVEVLEIIPRCSKPLSWIIPT